MYKDKGLCKEPIPYFEKAQAVSPTLAKKEKIKELIAELTAKCTIDTTCKTNIKFVLAAINEANKLFLDCRYEEALEKYEVAKKNVCDDASKTAVENWKVFEDDIKANKDLVSLFNKRIRSADSLFNNGECEEAKKLYLLASIMEVKCEKLVKTDIPKKIKEIKLSAH